MMNLLAAILIACACGSTTVNVNPSSVGPTMNSNILGDGTTNVYNLTRSGIPAAFQAANIKYVRYPDGGNVDFTNPITGLNGPAGTPCAGNANPSSDLANFYSSLAVPANLNVALELNYGSDPNCDPGVGAPTSQTTAVVTAALADGNVSSATV
ncbi:MAG: hypothetical protein KGL39_34415, partial [Patescibacteria group bacterium]|nr:hypothetical protein [Patescibacteria group bacterium]